MKVIIEGNFDQVASFLEAPSFAERPSSPLTDYGSTRALKGEGRVARRNAILREQADTLRAAFLLVRRNPNETELADSFVAALVGREERTDAILEKASEIILSRQAPPSSSEGGQ